MHANCNLPNSLFPVIPLSLRSSVLLFPLKRRAGLPGISTKCGITRCNETRYKSIKNWMRQYSRRKIVPQTGKRVRDILTSTVRIQHNPQVKQPQHVCRRPTAYPLGIHCSILNTCEPCLVDCGLALLVGLTPLVPTFLPPHLLLNFLSSTKFLAVDFCICMLPLAAIGSLSND